MNSTIFGLFSATIVLLLVPFFAGANEHVIKLSKSGICHDETSSAYDRTKNYTPFASIEACLKAGGRLTKSKTKQYDEAESEAIEQNRDFVKLYDRDEWPHWIDSDGDCQNTRQELLIATSKKPVKYRTSKKCTVAFGEWFDPYSGEIFHDSKSLDLDHIVPLKFAHGRGGDKWSRERKQAFANDVDNLILVDASLNRQKGAKSPIEWMPPNHSYRCKYLSSFNAVMEKHGVFYLPSEKRIIEKMTQACNR